MSNELKKGDLVVVHSPRLTADPMSVKVKDLPEARLALHLLADYDKHLLKHGLVADEAATQTLLQFDGEELLEWDPAEDPVWVQLTAEAGVTTTTNLADYLLNEVPTKALVFLQKAYDVRSSSEPTVIPLEMINLKISLDLSDQGHESSSNQLKASVQFTKQCVQIGFAGYGECNAAPGHGMPVVIEVLDGHPRVLIWADITKEDPTHVVSLAGAAESLASS